MSRAQSADGEGVEPHARKHHLVSNQRPARASITILKQRKAEGMIPMRVTAPPVFETGAVPSTTLPSMG